MNRFQLALQIYEKLNPNAAIDGEDTSIQAGYLIDQTQSRLHPTAHGLAAYIRSIQPLPYYTMLLGICQDHLPLLLDLEHYQTGPILITGSHSNSMRAYLISVLRSGVIINQPNLLEYICVTSGALTFEDQFSLASDTVTFHPADRNAQASIMRLSALVEQRNTGRQRGRVVILAIEDLDTLVHYMDDDVYAHFLWLLREGPFAGVWPITTLRAGSRLFTDFKFEALFDTRIRVSNFEAVPADSSFDRSGASQPHAVHQVITGDHTISITFP